MTISNEVINSFTPLERALFDALQEHMILSHAVVQTLGYDISLGRSELDRLNATIHRYNKKVSIADKIIHASHESKKSGLLPVLMRRIDYETQKPGS